MVRAAQEDETQVGSCSWDPSAQGKWRVQGSLHGSYQGPAPVSGLAGVGPQGEEQGHGVGPQGKRRRRGQGHSSSTGGPLLHRFQPIEETNDHIGFM